MIGRSFLLYLLSPRYREFLYSLPKRRYTEGKSIIAAKGVPKGKDLTDDEKGMLAVFDHAVDFTRQSPLRPLILELDPQNPHFTESTPS